MPWRLAPEAWGWGEGTTRRKDIRMMLGERFSGPIKLFPWSAFRGNYIYTDALTSHLVFQPN